MFKHYIVLFFRFILAIMRPSELTPQYIKNRQHIKMNKYKQNIAIMANWCRQSDEWSLAVFVTSLSDFLRVFLTLLCILLSSSKISLSSENASSTCLRPLVSLSVRLIFFFIILRDSGSRDSRLFETFDLWERV